MIFGRTKTDAVKANVISGKELAAALARDRRFRKHLVAALGHGELARRRAARQVTAAAMLARLAADEDLRRELATATKNLQQAWARVERQRSHRLRNTMLVLGGAAAVAALVQSRERVREQATKLRRTDQKPEAPASAPAPATGLVEA